MEKENVTNVLVQHIQNAKMGIRHITVGSYVTQFGMVANSMEWTKGQDGYAKKEVYERVKLSLCVRKEVKMYVVDVIHSANRDMSR